MTPPHLERPCSLTCSERVTVLGHMLGIYVQPLGLIAHLLLEENNTIK